MLSTRTSTCARSLLLAALLAVCGVQLLETQHDHGGSGYRAECLLCQAPAAAPAAIAAPLPQAYSLPSAQPQLGRAVPCASPVRRHRARAPPENA